MSCSRRSSASCGSATWRPKKRLTVIRAVTVDVSAPESAFSPVAKEIWIRNLVAEEKRMPRGVCLRRREAAPRDVQAFFEGRETARIGTRACFPGLWNWLDSVLV